MRRASMDKFEMCHGPRIQLTPGGLGFIGFRVLGLGFRVLGLGFWV